jgi:hypothetical protein
MNELCLEGPLGLDEGQRACLAGCLEGQEAESSNQRLIAQGFGHKSRQ